jgi:hypothetical protein
VTAYPPTLGAKQKSSSTTALALCRLKPIPLQRSANEAVFPLPPGGESLSNLHITNAVPRGHTHFIDLQ